MKPTPWPKQLSNAEVQKVVAKWAAWLRRRIREGKGERTHLLRDTRKLLSHKKGRVVTDGPFAESKEAIGGRFSPHVGDEAEAIAQQCPGLECGNARSFSAQPAQNYR